MELTDATTGVVLLVQSVDDEGDELLIINGPPGSNQFLGESSHDGDILLRCLGLLLVVGEGSAEVGNASLGSRSKSGGDEIGGMLQADRLREDVLGHGVEQVAQHLLVLLELGVVRRVRGRRFLAVLLRSQSFRRRRLLAGHHAEQPCSTKGRRDLGFP